MWRGAVFVSSFSRAVVSRRALRFDGSFRSTARSSVSRAFRGFLRLVGRLVGRLVRRLVFSSYSLRHPSSFDEERGAAYRLVVGIRRRYRGGASPLGAVVFQAPFPVVVWAWLLLRLPVVAWPVVSLASSSGVLAPRRPCRASRSRIVMGVSSVVLP